MEVVKESHHASQGKVKRTESENREDIRGVYEKGIYRDAQNGRNRVYREDDVRRLHYQEHKEQRCRGVMSGLLHEEMVGVVVLCHRYQATEELEQRILVRMDLFIFPRGHFDAGEDEQGAEDIEDPVQPLEQRNTGKNEDGAHHQCTQNAPEEDFMLVARWHLEVRKDQREDEDIIDAERLLDQVTGEEFECWLWTLPGVHTES